MSPSELWPLWFRQLGVHQDYFWFFALLGWAFTLVFWWWHPERRTKWRWLPWTAGAGVAGAAVQFAIFNPPFDFFQQRLVPGTIANFRPALIEVEVLGDWTLGAIMVGLAAGWGWALIWPRVGKFARACGVVLLFGAAASHIYLPWISGAFVAGVMVLGLWFERAETRLMRERLAIWGAALVPLLTTVGLVAWALDQMQRSGPPTPMGLLAAMAQVLVAACVLVALVPGVMSSRQGLGWGAQWRSGRRATLWGALWLVGGLIFAQQTGRDNRAELHNNRLRVNAARAALFNSNLLRALEQLPPWRDVEFAGSSGRAQLPPETVKLARAISLELLAERRATPFILGARVLVPSNGWLLAIASSHAEPPPGVATVLRRMTPADEQAWQEARTYVETSPVAEISSPYYCRAALRGADGRMLAWLEFEQVEFFQSIERKWRSGPLLVTALGLILGATLLFQRRAEREREAAVRAAAVQEESNRLKSAFLATVSHELRTPLHALLGCGEMLALRVAHDREAVAWLASLQQQGELMTRLVNDLIDLGAIEAGTFRLRAEPVDPAALVRETVAGLRAQAQKKALSLDCSSVGALPERVALDGGRFRQVLTNLIGNAVKFTERGGVEVRTWIEEIGHEDAGLRLIVAVRDSGPGIPASERAKLFHAFVRLEGAERHEGSGLGLAVSAALCRAMGGSIQVASDGRTYSEFTAEFRVEKLSGESGIERKASETEPAPSLSGRRVLVVEDNALVRTVFVEMLQSAGAECRVASTPEAALTIARHGDTDVVLLDLGLPRMGGLELAPRLRELLPQARVIGASAHAGEAERQAALAAGMDDFVTKPVSREVLLAAVGCVPVVGLVSDVGDWRRELEMAFQRELPALHGRLRAAVAAQDFPAIREVAHYLANSAAAVGNKDLLQDCERLVMAAQRSDGQEVRQLWGVFEGRLGGD